MDSSTNDKSKAGGSPTAFVPQNGGASTHEPSKLGSEAPEPTTKFEGNRARTARPIENLATTASDKAKEYRGKAENAWDATQGRVRSFHEESERYVRANPIKAVVSALGIGFVFGLIFHRR